ncbi:LysR family transcriptional regulator [Marinobacterium rhizophilum]|uniref:LysR family transcriptional regulator n=1 Tax=Marinobacterium rhizophilum TaxID=420402 RepID=A0ABY5HEY7_9GAMM|nr:LysR family transcriptional regulator [Marinobacterium rhizophilum]UTW10529.1 LysR family transcriptional regulator [Marinobacterium rhizophilum]
MDTLLLKTFLEVSRTRNFGRASENLCVSASTVSARIRQLEDHLGLSLFTRQHHRIGLTPAGERMERHARFILGAWERAFEDTALSERHKRRLVVAGVASLWDIFVQDWLNGIYRDFPSLGLRAEESTPLRVVEKLEQGMIDVGFMYEPPRIQNVAVQEVANVALSLVSSRAGQSVDAAIGEGYIRVEWGTTFASLHESHFPQRLLARGRVNSGRLALNLIQQCGGAAYLPQGIVQPLLETGQLHRVADAPVIKMKAYAAYGLHGEHHQLVTDLLDRLKG